MLRPYEIRGSIGLHGGDSVLLLIHRVEWRRDLVIVPCVLGDLTQSVHLHHSFDNLPKHGSAVLGDEGYNLRPSQGIIKIL
jgi:hypothetical protein